MEATAGVLGICILICLVAICASLTLVAWVIAWDEIDHIRKRRKHRRAMDRQFEDWTDRAQL